MPIYEYKCIECGTFELLQKVTDDKIEVCPTCGKEVEKLISTVNHKYCGTGFYETDYKKKRKPKEEKKQTEANKKETKHDKT